jgi:hypothetical protein
MCSPEKKAPLLLAQQKYPLSSQKVPDTFVVCQKFSDAKDTDFSFSAVKHRNRSTFTLMTTLLTTGRTKAEAKAIDVVITDDSIDVTLVDGRRVSAPLEWFPRLRNATPKQRANWRFIGPGIGIHWEEIDEDISVRSLLATEG